MQKNIPTLFLVILLVSPFIGAAQSGNILTQTLTWRSVRAINLKTSDTLSMDMNFKSFTTDKIEYIGPRGPNQTFDITSTEGTWTNIAQHGSVTYHVTLVDQPGTIIIARSDSGFSLTVDMTTAATGGMKMKFIVNQPE